MMKSTRVVGTVDVVKLNQLTLDPANARRHDDRNIDAIRSSLRVFGQQHPILVGLDGVVIAGNGRLEAMRADGWTECDVRWSDLEGERRAAFAVADNRTGELAAWDDETLARTLASLDDDMVIDVGFTAEELAALLQKGAGEKKPDRPPKEDQASALQQKWGTESGQLWVAGKHRMICGDATDTDTMQHLMAGHQADCLFTSPPYGVGVDYGETYEDSIDNLRAMLPVLAKVAMQQVTAGGYAVINFGDVVAARDLVGTEEPCEYPMALEYWPAFRNAGWTLWSRRVWVKPGAGTGSMQCIQSNRAATNWEHVWTWKSPGKTLHDKQTTGKYASQRGWIDTTSEHRLEVGLDTHGAGMPVAVAEWAIDVHVRPGQIVLEPFMGTGTTIVAAERLGRRARGIEINPSYMALTLERLQLLGLEPVLAPE